MNTPSQHPSVSRSAEKSLAHPTNTQTNPNILMKENSTDTAASKASRSLASARTYTRTEVAAAGTPLNMQPSDGGTYAVAAGGFTIRPGGALVTARVTIDDSGTMEIRHSGFLDAYGGFRAARPL